jgi:hypothetical protein
LAKGRDMQISLSGFVTVDEIFVVDVFVDDEVDINDEALSTALVVVVPIKPGTIEVVDV